MTFRANLLETGLLSGFPCGGQRPAQYSSRTEVFDVAFGSGATATRGSAGSFIH